MAYYKFSIIEYRLMQDGDEKYIDHNFFNIYQQTFYKPFKRYFFYECN